MYQLFCDTNCELWHTTAKELGLRVIRMPYVLDGKEYYYDLGEATDFAHFYRRMREGAVPTTSAINEQDYIDYFEPVLQEGQDIYYITFSHKMSATFQSMDRAIAGLLQKYPGRQIRTFPRWTSWTPTSPSSPRTPSSTSWWMTSSTSSAAAASLP